MPINPSTGDFERIWNFTDQANAGDPIARSDLDVALNDFVPAMNQVLDRQSALDGANLYSSRGFSRIADLTADVTLTYLADELGSVVAGDVVNVYASGDCYEVLAQGATVFDATTAGGVRLQYIAKTKEAIAVTGFGSIADVLADTSLSYAPAIHGGVIVGQKILALEELQVYEIAASSATTHDATTSGGVKLFRLSRAVTKLGPHIILEHRATSGTGGGDFTAGMDRTRPLTTEVIDQYSQCNLASNQFTLLAGSYSIAFEAGVGAVGAHQAFVFNVSDNTVAFRGMSAGAGGSSFGSGIVTIAATKTFELRHRCTTTAAGSGFGVPSSFGQEVFARVAITSVDLG